METKFYCPKCKEEMKLQDMGGSYMLYCPKCGGGRKVDYVEYRTEIVEE